MADTARKNWSRGGPAFEDLNEEQQEIVKSIADALGGPRGNRERRPPKTRGASAGHDYWYDQNDDRAYVKPKGAMEWLVETDDGGWEVYRKGTYADPREDYVERMKRKQRSSSDTEARSVATGGDFWDTHAAKSPEDRAKDKAEFNAWLHGDQAKPQSETGPEGFIEYRDIPTSKRGRAWDAARDRGLKLDAKGNIVDPGTGKKVTWNASAGRFE
jgi:hypothetical protein